MLCFPPTCRQGLWGLRAMWESGAGTGLWRCSPSNWSRRLGKANASQLAGAGGRRGGHGPRRAPSSARRCPYLHRTTGDTERKYHLRYYKTGTCIHETDARGHCAKNGPHCAFAHGPLDLRPPVCDVR